MPDLPYREPHYPQFKVNIHTPPLSIGRQHISKPVHPGTGIIIVIPCYIEPDIIPTLSSLWNCIKPQCRTEVIIVINAPENSPDEILNQNEKTYCSALEWIQAHADEKLQFHIIRRYDLPHKHAGVGLTRKIGMDEAAQRFGDIGKEKGIIVCFDSDCLCSRNFLKAIEKHFIENPDTHAASIYFEHPLSGNDFPEEVYSGILRYELFLRYYRQGLKFAGLPYAYHTIGSCMAVRADIYMHAGGMNKRKAGEDFYFLQKIIPLGHFTEINTTRVIPSPRPSDRVPFGTGITITKWLAGERKEFPVFSFQTFSDLKQLCDSVTDIHSNHSKPEYVLPRVSESMKSFLINYDFHNKMEEIRQNSASAESFTKRFFQWFNAFMALKYAHFARDNYYGLTDIGFAARELLHKMNVKQEKDSLQEMLMTYRRIDKTG